MTINVNKQAQLGNLEYSTKTAWIDHTHFVATNMAGICPELPLKSGFTLTNVENVVLSRGHWLHQHPLHLPKWKSGHRDVL